MDYGTFTSQFIYGSDYSNLREKLEEQESRFFELTPSREACGVIQGIVKTTSVCGEFDELVCVLENIDYKPSEDIAFVVLGKGNDGWITKVLLKKDGSVTFKFLEQD